MPVLASLLACRPAVEVGLWWLESPLAEADALAGRGGSGMTGGGEGSDATDALLRRLDVIEPDR